jgi:hypothetical protein
VVNNTTQKEDHRLTCDCRLRTPLLYKRELLRTGGPNTGTRDFDSLNQLVDIKPVTEASTYSVYNGRLIPLPRVHSIEKYIFIIRFREHHEGHIGIPRS